MKVKKETQILSAADHPATEGASYVIHAIRRILFRDNASPAETCWCKDGDIKITVEYIDAD